MICVAAFCRTSNSPLLKLNTAMTYKIGTKALSPILDAMKLIRSPPIDSCSEYDPNDYSNLEESKGRWPVLFTHQGACSNLARFY